jgi:hypothetical protein
MKARTSRAFRLAARSIISSQETTVQHESHCSNNYFNMCPVKFSFCNMNLHVRWTARLTLTARRNPNAAPRAPPVATYGGMARVAPGKKATIINSVRTYAGSFTKMMSASMMDSACNLHR